jgi:hypothetical protein
MARRVHKPKSIKELFRVGGKRLAALSVETRERSKAREHVCAALPPKLAQTVVTAGIVHGRLNIGVAGATWAARLRYVTESLRLQVGASMGVDIHSVRIRVVPPRA